MSRPTRLRPPSRSGSPETVLVCVGYSWLSLRLVRGGSEKDAERPAAGLDAVVDQHAAPADKPRGIPGAARQELVLVRADVAVHRASAHAGHIEDASAEQFIDTPPHAHVGDLAASPRTRALRVRVLALKP